MCSKQMMNLGDGVGSKMWHVDPSLADGAGCAIAVVLLQLCCSWSLEMRQCSSPSHGSGEAEVEACTSQRHKDTNIDILQTTWKRRCS